jgi:hypothetical protein
MYQKASARFLVIIAFVWFVPYHLIALFVSVDYIYIGVPH